jgi:hypothetical protein
VNPWEERWRVARGTPSNPNDGSLEAAGLLAAVTEARDVSIDAPVGRHHEETPMKGGSLIFEELSRVEARAIYELKNKFPSSFKVDKIYATGTEYDDPITLANLHGHGPGMILVLEEAKPLPPGATYDIRMSWTGDAVFNALAEIRKHFVSQTKT